MVQAMFPMGIRIWDQNRMIYPVKFSVYLDLEKNISSIKTLIEGKKYQTFNYMMLTTGIAINGYIYEKDIIMIDGEEDKVGIVEFDKKEGAFVVKIKGETFIVNESMDFCEILGNVYEDTYLLDMYSLTFNNDIIFDEFKDNDIFEEEEYTVNKENVIDNLNKTEISEPVEDIIVKEESVTEVIENENIKIEDENISEINNENIIEQEVVNELIEPEINIEEESINKEEIVEEKVIEEENNNSLIEENIEQSINETTQNTIDINEDVIKEKIMLEEITLEEIGEVQINEQDVEIIEITEIDEEVIDSNLFMGAEDLVFLDDTDLDEPIEEVVAEEDDLLDNISLEPLAEELPPDDIFGDGIKEDVKVAAKEEKIEAEEIIIYAIGYCAVDNGPGTYSYIINADNENVKEFSGGLENTILNRIQLIGVIEALKNIKDCDNIKVYCDSKYVISPFIKGWIYKWQQNDWKKDSDNKVLNCDLWEEIFELTKDFSIQWEFVKDVNNIQETKQCLDNAKKEISKYIK
jgi:ribonuclease HI